MKRRAKRRLSLSVKGAKWKAILYSQKTFLCKHGANLYAVTIPTSREIHFQQGHFTLAIVRHEVRHAFTSELCLNDDTITVEELEEIQCCLDERHWDDMDKVSREIFNFLG